MSEQGRATWMQGYEFALRNLHDEPVQADLQRLTAGVNAGPDVSHASDGADDAPDEAKGAAPTAPAPAVTSRKRHCWLRLRWHHWARGIERQGHVWKVCNECGAQQRTHHASCHPSCWGGPR